MTKTTKKKKEQTKDNKNTLVHVGFLLDESGSMHEKREDVVAGYNEFVEQLEDPEHVRVTLATFDAPSPFNVDGSKNKDREIIRYPKNNVPLEEHEALKYDEYNPRGATPLYDAVVRMIAKMDKKVKKDDKAMLIIMTDGMENASKEGSDIQAKKMIADREEKGWAFIYLGSNQDAWNASAGLGLDSHGKNFTTSNTRKGMKNQMVSAGAISSLYISSDKDSYADSMASFSAKSDAKLSEEVIRKEDLTK